MMNKNNCGSYEFISQPNQYDVSKFDNEGFEIEYTENIDEYSKIFCRECSSKIDQEKSLQQKQVILKNKIQSI